MAADELLLHGTAFCKSVKYRLLVLFEFQLDCGAVYLLGREVHVRLENDDVFAGSVEPARTTMMVAPAEGFMKLELIKRKPIARRTYYGRNSGPLDGNQRQAGADRITPRHQRGARQAGTFTQTFYDETKKNGWTLTGMKNDWNRIFAFEK